MRFTVRVKPKSKTPSAILQNLTNQAGVSETACAACNALEDAASKEQCRAQLGCS